MTPASQPTPPNKQKLITLMQQFCESQTTDEAGLAVDLHADGRAVDIRVFPRFHPIQSQVLESLWWSDSAEAFEVSGFTNYTLATEQQVRDRLADIERRRSLAIMKSELGEANTAIDPTYGYLRARDDGLSSPDDVCVELYVSEMRSIALAADGKEVTVKGRIPSDSTLSRADYQPSASYPFLYADGYMLGGPVTHNKAGQFVTITGKRCPLKL